jgi:hypothetical protein
MPVASSLFGEGKPFIAPTMFLICDAAGCVKHGFTDNFLGQILRRVSEAKGGRASLLNKACVAFLATRRLVHRLRLISSYPPAQ